MGQRSQVGGYRSEVRGQRLGSEAGVRGRRSAAVGQRSEVRGWGQRLGSEVASQRSAGSDVRFKDKSIRG